MQFDLALGETGERRVGLLLFGERRVEKLHRFVLRNADEPAFSVQLYSGPRDD